MAPYVGTYQFPPKVKMMLTLDGDRLMTQLSGQQKIQLFPEINGKFFPKVVDAELEFLKDTDGKVTDVILHQNGRDQKAPRISDTVLERRAIKLKPEILASYAGPYTTGANPVTVAVKGDHLTMKVGPQEWDLFPDSETTFFLKDVDVQLEILKGPDGAVKGLVSHIGPQDIAATRQ